MRRVLTVFAGLFMLSISVAGQDEYAPANYAIILNSQTKMHEEPHHDSALVATAPAGTKLTVTGESTYWLLVTYEDQELWMDRWLGHTPLPPPVSQALIDNPIAPMIPFSRLPECTADENLDWASSQIAQGVLDHIVYASGQHARGATLSAEDYILHRDAFWSVAPFCSPLFEVYVWLVLNYAEILLLNFQMDVAPDARDDPRVAALHDEWHSHPSNEVIRAYNSFQGEQAYNESE